MLIIFSLWIISTLILKLFFGDWSKSGSFGDTFGAINSLFSGLALAGIIYTIYLQKTELSLQREELKYTREELKRTADAQESSNKMMNEQLKINNMPLIQLKSKIEFNQNFSSVYLKNIGNTPIFDLEIVLFLMKFNVNDPLSVYKNEKVKEEYRGFINNELISKDGIWSVYRQDLIDLLPKDKTIRIPLIKDNSIPIYYRVFIQYRDLLNNNYYKDVSFSYETLPNPIKINEIKPKIPTPIERVYLGKGNSSEINIENYNELEELFNSSIYIDKLIDSKKNEKVTIID